MFGPRVANKNPSLSEVVAADTNNDTKNKKDTKSGGSSITGFDPEGLERAAKAARDLDSSRNASAAIELIKTQEATKQQEYAMKRSEMDAYTQQQRATNIDKEAEQARQTLQAQTQHEKQRADYQDHLERKRQVDMLNAQKYMQEEQLKKQEEMALRQEEMRRKTAQYENELRIKTEIAKAKAESDGKIQQERLNHDLIIDKVKLEASEYRNTILKAIQDGGQLLGTGLSSYLDDKEKLMNTALTVTYMAVGIYTAKTTIGITGRYIESRFGKPSLVRDTSRFSILNTIQHPIQYLQSTFRRARSGYNNTTDTNVLKGIVLEPQLDEQLRQIAMSTANTKKNKAPFRHLLLHGPPGTGKTLFARGLAQHSGLDYAILTGGDIAPLGRDAVTELHKLFDWAKTSRKGLLLFVDEADAFLQSRAVHNQKISEDQRNALNAFLYRTGTESDQFMMVYASNQPQQFDGAIMDRIDEMVEFHLPGPEERKRMIIEYMEKYLLNPPGRYTKKVTTVDIGPNEIERVVGMTNGFSGRAISKLAIAWQAAAYGTDTATLDQKAFFRTVELHQNSMITKEKWINDAADTAKQLTTDAPSRNNSTATTVIDV